MSNAHLLATHLSELPFYNTKIDVLQKASHTAPSVMIASFETRSNEDSTRTITCTPWTKAELHTIAKDFPNVKEDSIEFAKQSDLLTKTYEPGYSDLYPLIHLLVGDVIAKE